MLDRKTIEEDLRFERPTWIMSAYGPGRDAPIQLFGGELLEQSMEEIRTMHYLNLASGNPQQSVRLPRLLPTNLKALLTSNLGSNRARIGDSSQSAGAKRPQRPRWSYSIRY